jgi:hypothetical protein
MAGADAQHNPAWRQDVQGCGVRRHVHGLPDACLDHVGAQLQGCSHGRGATQGRPRRDSGAGMVAHQQRAEASRLQAARQRQPRPEVSRLGLHAHRDVGHEANLPAGSPAEQAFRRPANEPAALGAKAVMLAYSSCGMSCRSRYR